MNKKGFQGSRDCKGTLAGRKICFKYTSRADMATDIRDTLDVVEYINNLTKRVEKLEKANEIVWNTGYGGKVDDEM